MVSFLLPSNQEDAMNKIWLITLTMTLASLTPPASAAAQVAPVPGVPGSPRPADVSARPNQKEKHFTDAEFTQEALAGGRKEVASATFAALTASSPDVKALANRLVKDHTSANQDLERMMSAKKHAFKEVPPSTKSESWRTETGASFDRAYVEYVIDEHEDAIELFEEQSAKGTDTELKAWAGGKLPTLREHLKMARDLKSKLGS
jgi:putative membrane protein